MHAVFHSCIHCGFATRLPILLERHMKRCGSNLSSSLMSSATLSQPSSLPAPSVCRNYKCCKCSFVSNKAKLFLYHQRQVHGENIAVYGCNECEYASRHKNKVLRHKRLVHKVISSPDDILALEDQSPMNITDDVTAFDSVDGSERQLQDGREHVTNELKETNSSTDTSSACVTQEQVANVSESDLSGMEKTATKPDDDQMAAFLGKWLLPKANVVDGLYRCKFCRYSNPHKWKIASHMRTSHSRKTLYKCSQCSFVTERKIEWCTHKTLHSGKMIYSCNECAYQTTMKRNFERHQERHLVNGPRRCSLCSYSSTGEGAIQRHMAEYHPPSPEKVDVCLGGESQPSELDADENLPNIVVSGSCHTVSGSSECLLFSEMPPVFSVVLPSISNHVLATSTPVTLSSVLVPSVSYSDKRLANFMTNSGNSTLMSRENVNLLKLSSVGGGGGVTSRSGESRWTCSLCPLGYKRAADLNRHMKRKHGTSLKDIKPTTSSSLSASSLHDCRSNQNVSESEQASVSALNSYSLERNVLILNDRPFPERNSSLSVSSCTPANDSPIDQPLNLSLKKTADDSIGSIVQLEVLDLSKKSRSSEVDLLDITPHFQCDWCSFTCKKLVELEHHSMQQHKYILKHLSAVAAKHFDAQMDVVARHVPCRPNISSNALMEAPAIIRNVRNSKECPRIQTTLLTKSSSEASLKNSLLTHSESVSRRPADAPYLEPIPICKGKHAEDFEHNLEQHSNDNSHQRKHNVIIKTSMTNHLLTRHQKEFRNIDHSENIRGLLDLTYQLCDDEDDIDEARAKCHMREDGFDDDSNYVDYNMNVEMNENKLPRKLAVFTSQANKDKEVKRKCPFPNCHFSCETSSSLKVHLESHDGLKRFMCMHCGKRSSWLWDIRKHIRKIHPGVDMTIRELSEEEARSLPLLEDGLPSADEPDGAEGCMKDDTKSDISEKSTAADRDLQFSCPQKEEPMDVEQLAEQYANEVAAMFYGVNSLNIVENSPCTVAGTWNKTVNKSSDHRIIAVKKFGRPSKSLLMNRFRPFKCSECGRRSNWRWDLNKHIRASHPNAHLIELTETEAKATFHELLHRDIRDHRQRPVTTAPVESGECSRFKLYTEDISNQGSTDRLSEFNGQGKETVGLSGVPEETSSSIDTSDCCRTVDVSSVCTMTMSTCVTVDSHKLKRFKCSACPYRSNFRSDVGRHIRHKHDKGTSRILVMSESEAAQTLKEYMETWARKKFVSSPSKKRSGQKRSFFPLPSTAEIQFKQVSIEDGKQEFLVCNVCGFKDESKAVVIEHWDREHSSKVASCPSTGLIPKGGTIEGTMESMVTENCPTLTAARGAVTEVHLKRTGRKQAEHTGSSVKNLLCSICPYQTSKTGLLNIHKTYHRQNGRNKFKCRYCPYYVCASRLLHQHMRLHLREDCSNKTDSGAVKNSETQPLVMDDNIDNPAVVSSQEATTRSLGRTTYCCVKCPYVSSNRNDYLYHRQFHRPRNTPAFKCDQCPYWVSQKRLLAQHVKVHGKEYQERHAILVSKRCSPNTDTEQGNQADATVIDGMIIGGRSTISGDTGGQEVEKYISCGGKLCYEPGKENSSQKEYEAEIVGKYFCRDCPFVTAKLPAFEDHLNLHDSGQKFVCGLCNFNADSVNQLCQHKKFHEYKEISADKLTRLHVTDDTSESHYDETRKAYCCDKCPYSNVRRDHLMCHMKFHEVKSDLQCPHCTYSVSRVHLLNQHLKVHVPVVIYAAQELSANAREAYLPSSGRQKKVAKNQTDDGCLVAENLTSFVIWMNQKAKACSSATPSIDSETWKDNEVQRKNVFMFKLGLKCSVDPAKNTASDGCQRSNNVPCSDSNPTSQFDQSPHVACSGIDY